MTITVQFRLDMHGYDVVTAPGKVLSSILSFTLKFRFDILSSTVVFVLTLTIWTIGIWLRGGC